jgi:hypothetical protein
MNMNDLLMKFLAVRITFRLRTKETIYMLTEKPLDHIPSQMNSIYNFL